ncbi:MAG: nicotinamide riboside transporter PnuC [Tannerellaceae bacterium]|nr:nicotinamide riboside transporter PnuC [Tannerellaceae bacterium]
METALEYFGVVTGLLYLFLEIRQHRAMWIIGFMTSFVYVVVFFLAKVYADMGLNLYYTGISLYGFWQWSKQRKSTSRKEPTQEAILYRHVTSRLLGGILGSIGIIFLVIYFSLAQFTDSPIPAGDAFTTAIGIVATWMLARRIIEHWLFWVIANAVSIYFYYVRGLYPTMFLYFCYTLLAIVGWYTWKKKGEESYDKDL